MKRWMQFGLLLIAMAALSVVTGCQSLFAPQLKVPAGCKAKAGTVAEPYSKTGWAKEVIHEKTGIELVYIPAGTFMMGSPADEAGRFDNEVPHRVTISHGFYMGKYEVTQAQWQKIVPTNPSSFKGDTLPVERVSWDDCQLFCTKSVGGLRLPTEAEWEYACRAGGAGSYGGSGDLAEMGWFTDNSGSTNPAVGQKKPNGWGLYDMHGNVWEWCSDWFGAYPTGDVTDPTGAATGSDRVSRSGSWVDYARDCRSATRNRLGPGYRALNLGFRVVLPAVQ